MTWTYPGATPIDFAAIEACREEVWWTAAEVRDCVESGRGCNDHSDRPRRVYPAKSKKPTRKPCPN